MKKFLCLCSALIVSLFTFTSVNALTIAEAGDVLKQDGSYDSTRIIAGNTVTNTADVDGLSIIAGNEVVLSGSAPYGFYAGNLVTINENIEKDMFVAGNDITIGNEAVIGRDVFIAGNIIKIDTDVTRDLRVGGSRVDISGITIGGDAYIAAEEIIMDEDTIIEGKLTYPDNATVTGLNKSNVGSIELIEQQEIVIEYNMVDRVRDFVVSCIASFVTMAVLFYIIPSAKEKLDNTELTASSIIKRVAIGLAILVVVPMVSLIAMFTGVLTPLAFISFAFYIMSIYLSSLLVYYIVGKLIASNLFKNDNVYLALVTGIVVVKIIKYIPVIGGIVGAFTLFYGLGLIFKFIFRGKNQA